MKISNCTDPKSITSPNIIIINKQTNTDQYLFKKWFNTKNKKKILKTKCRKNILYTEDKNKNHKNNLIFKDRAN